MSTVTLTPEPCNQSPDALLLAFREAAEIEHRLLWLESWLVDRRPARGTWEWFLHFDRACLRLQKLLQLNSRLAPFENSIRAYLLQLHEGQL